MVSLARSPRSRSELHAKSSRRRCLHTRSQSSTGRQGTLAPSTASDAGPAASCHLRSRTRSSVSTVARNPPWYSQCRTGDHPETAALASRAVSAHTGSPRAGSPDAWTPVLLERAAARIAAATASVGGSRATAPLRRARRASPWRRKVAAIWSRHHPCSEASKEDSRRSFAEAFAPKKASRAAVFPLPRLRPAR